MARFLRRPSAKVFKRFSTEFYRNSQEFCIYGRESSVPGSVKLRPSCMGGRGLSGSEGSGVLSFRLADNKTCCYTYFLT